MERSDVRVDIAALQGKYQRARSQLLFVLVFTLINIVLLAVESNTYFLFSAFVPYFIVDFGMLLCGMMPGVSFDGTPFDFLMLDRSAFPMFLAIALILVSLYFLSWLFSKKDRVGWLVFALVIFSIDTLLLFYFVGFSLDNILNIVFHVWVIVSLSLGINAHYKLKRMAEQENVLCEETATQELVDNLENSIALRIAEQDVKHRVLLETVALGHKICYRRVKKVNELVIDGYVYSQYVATVEFAHALTAKIDGHTIEVGFDGMSHSYLKIDGNTVMTKVRLF